MRMLGGLDEALPLEQPPIVLQGQPRAQMQLRQAEPARFLLGCGEQGAGDAAAPPGWRHGKPAHIEAAILLPPDHRADQPRACLRHRAAARLKLGHDAFGSFAQRGWKGIDVGRQRREGLADHVGHARRVLDARRPYSPDHGGMVAARGPRAYLAAMAETPAFLDTGRPAVPDIVVPRAVTPFHLHRRPVRGRLIRLGALADALLTRHDNHPVVTGLAGSALALAAALASTMKFRGSFSLQAKGDGPVDMLLADCTDQGALRGYARADAGKLDALLAEEPEPTAQRLLGSGYLAFTVDQGEATDRYQGIVQIEGVTLADMAEHYFATSEQLRCAVRLACTRTPSGWRAGALVLQRVAGAGGIDPDMDAEAQDDAWRTALALAATLTDAELLDDTLLPERVLYRLFHAEGLVADRPRALAYGCRCSRAKLSGILEGFGPEDLDHMSVDGDIVMNCEFCNLAFRFPRDTVHSRTAGRA